MESVSRELSKSNRTRLNELLKKAGNGYPLYVKSNKAPVEVETRKNCYIATIDEEAEGVSKERRYIPKIKLVHFDDKGASNTVDLVQPAIFLMFVKRNQLVSYTDTLDNINIHNTTTGHISNDEIRTYIKPKNRVFPSNSTLSSAQINASKLVSLIELNLNYSSVGNRDNKWLNTLFDFANKLLSNHPVTQIEFNQFSKDVQKYRPIKAVTEKCHFVLYNTIEAALYLGVVLVILYAAGLGEVDPDLVLKIGVGICTAALLAFGIIKTKVACDVQTIVDEIGRDLFPVPKVAKTSELGVFSHTAGTPSETATKADVMIIPDTDPAP